MILANGVIYKTEAQNEIFATLRDKLTKTLTENTLDIEAVIDVFDAFGTKIKNGEFDELIDSIDYDGKESYRDMIIHMMSREYLEGKIKNELGDLPVYAAKTTSSLWTKRVPLGVLFHIAAGNMDVLPVTSVAEGLLAGNINLLKLPSADKGLTIQVLKMLVDAEPKLRDYIYVFDTPSTDVAAIKKLADLSDGIAVWGGDEVVSAVRTFSKPGTRLIEWGHKLGFCYVSGYENKELELQELAKHIMLTKQLLCSSCQVIYIDTEDFNDVISFAKEFGPYLDRAAKEHPNNEVGVRAEIALRRYTKELESITNQTTQDEVFFNGKNTSVTAVNNSELELSYLYGNVLVKPLPKEKIMAQLRLAKEYLQTAGLICEPQKREELTELLLRAGVERVTRCGRMSDHFEGEAHDGEYPLARYSRIVNVELGETM